MKSAAIDLGTLGYILGVLDGIIVDNTPLNHKEAAVIREMLKNDLGPELVSQITGKPESV